MPNITTTPISLVAGSAGGTGGFFGEDPFGSLLQTGSELIRFLFGGGNGGPMEGVPGQGPGGGGLDLPMVDVTPQGSGTFLQNIISSPYRPTRAGVRAQDFAMRNPVTGSLQYWRYAGRPIIYSRDRAICRAVQKTARRIAGPR